MGPEIFTLLINEDLGLGYSPGTPQIALSPLSPLVARDLFVLFCFKKPTSTELWIQLSGRVAFLAKVSGLHP